ncbi:acetyltransferase [Salmonella enterica subsp. enterica serovar Senftenberg str. ATCC 43845]|nr:acetyltransferase [Salmonella enterica subsp. enterica serovar Senftenberg str. ATCC 43845]
MCFFSIKPSSCAIICQPDTPQASTCIHTLGDLRNRIYFFRWLK